MASNLCQPGGGASCGACCGLYNFADHSRAALEAALAERTARISAEPRTLDRYRAAASELRTRTQPPLFSDVRICPLLGFLDPQRTRVGCLAHPLVTGGEDLRDCGVYNSRTCASFECPSYLWLSDAEAALVRDACADWYLYGLVITDVEFVRGCLRLLARALGNEPDCDRLRGDPATLSAVRTLFALKEHARGREPGADVFGRFAPDGTGDASLRTIDYPALQRAAAPEDDLVLCLGYAPRTGDQLEQAREQIRVQIAEVAKAVTAAEVMHRV